MLGVTGFGPLEEKDATDGALLRFLSMLFFIVAVGML